MMNFNVKIGRKFLSGFSCSSNHHKELVTQRYPLIMTFKQSEALINDYFKLIKLLKPNRNFTSEEYELSARIETALVHPNI